MLNNLQIERYSRQILLQPVGSRGQEQLLSSAVRIHGHGHATRRLATYLAGAGVGRLDCPEEPPTASLISRNPDVAWGPIQSPQMVVGIGQLPKAWYHTTPIIWATANLERITCIRATQAPACRPCFEAALLEMCEPGPVAEGLLAAVVATATLVTLLSINGASPNQGIELCLNTPEVRTINLTPHMH